MTKVQLIVRKIRYFHTAHASTVRIAGLAHVGPLTAHGFFELESWVSLFFKTAGISLEHLSGVKRRTEEIR